MNIGEVARRTNLPAKTIRYYEDIGLVVPARHPNGYRDYDDREIQVLRFLQTARSLGFTIECCRGFLHLYPNGDCKCMDQAIAFQWIKNIDRKVAELSSLREVVQRLTESANKDDLPRYPMLENLPAPGDRKQGEN